MVPVLVTDQLDPRAPRKLGDRLDLDLRDRPTEARYKVLDLRPNRRRARLRGQFPLGAAPHERRLPNQTCANQVLDALPQALHKVYDEITP